MDKNIIKKYLSEAFLTEVKNGGKDNNGKEAKVVDNAKATQEKKAVKGTQSTPGVKVTAKVNKESGTANKAGIKAVEKDMKDYEKPLKPDANAKEMAPNKFNFKDKEEEKYHNEMEIMNGMEMLQYDRTPDERFKERALEAIEGSSQMGNNPEWANVVEKGWGGDKEFGKNLAKRIKDSSKKRSAETPTFYMHGRDNSVDMKDTGHKPYALESLENKKRIVKENFMDEMGMYEAGQNHSSCNVTITNYKNNEFTAEVFKENNGKETTYHLYGPYESDGEGWNVDSAKEINSMGHERLLSPQEIDALVDEIHGELFAKMNEAHNRTGNEFEPPSTYGDPTSRDITTAASRAWGGMNENKKTNTPSIKENIKQTQTMKRLKFKKEFKGVSNALRLIPESYRVDSKVFEMTDGNESYKIRWEGSLKEGAAVVIAASDKKMVNEDMQKMKHLFNYKSQDTLGLVKGKDRLDENATFADIYAKTKKLLAETEDIEGQTADSEGEWDDAGITQAPEATKHVQGSVSTDKGTQAPAPKNGQWAEIKMTQAADAKKHIQGSVSTDKGTQAPAPKEGHWDKIKIHAAASPTGGSNGSTPKAEASVANADKVVKQAPEATKHVQGSVSTDKGTQAPAPKKGEWEKVKKTAPEATKDVKKK